MASWFMGMQRIRPQENNAANTMDQFDEKQKMFLLFPGFKSRSHQLSKMTNTNNKGEKFTNSKYKSV